MRTLVASLIVSAVVYSTNASAVEFKIASLQQRIFETIQSSMPAVVSVRQRGGMFSGVIVSKDGKILSAGHAVTPGATYQVFCRWSTIALVEKARIRKQTVLCCKSLR